MGARPEPFREGEVAAWWEPDRALVRLLAVNMADGLFEGEFVDRPGEIFTQDLNNICHRTTAYERWSTALQERFAAHGVSESTETAEARQPAWAGDDQRGTGPLASGERRAPDSRDRVTFTDAERSLRLDTPCQGWPDEYVRCGTLRRRYRSGCSFDLP
jgi:hypothetical protein